MAVKPIPDGYQTLMSYITVKGAKEAIAFYKDVFGAKERMIMDGPGGTVAHAELQFGDSVMMLSDEMPDMGAVSPKTLGGTGSGLMLYVADVDKTFARAVEKGAKTVRPVENQFYGDRSGTLEDPFGHKWTVGTHVEDVSPEEMQRRMAKMGG